MNTYGTIVLCALLSGSVIAVPAAGKSNQSVMDDSWVTAKTKIALFADSRVKGREINVETKRGVVIIRGKVDSDEAKNAAEAIAKNVDGAASVKNELQVVAPDQRALVVEEDSIITARIKRHLKDAKYSGVEIQTNAGVVSLTGHVETLMTSAKASWKVWKLRGVKAVKNDLSVTNS